MISWICHNGYTAKCPQTKTAIFLNDETLKRPETGTDTNNNSHNPKRSHLEMDTSLNGHTMPTCGNIYLSCHLCGHAFSCGFKIFIKVGEAVRYDLKTNRHTGMKYATEALKSIMFNNVAILPGIVGTSATPEEDRSRDCDVTWRDWMVVWTIGLYLPHFCPMSNHQCFCLSISSTTLEACTCTVMCRYLWICLADLKRAHRWKTNRYIKLF